MGEYKDPIKNDIEARYNLCKEIKEVGFAGTVTDYALLAYLVMSAYWSQRSSNVGHGVVTEKWASPKFVIQFTPIPRSSVYKSMTHLEQAQWIEVWEYKPGQVRVRVRLDIAGRQVRAKVLSQRQKISHRDSESPTETICLPGRMIKPGDLQEWALKD